MQQLAEAGRASRPRQSRLAPAAVASLTAAICVLGCGGSHHTPTGLPAEPFEQAAITVTIANTGHAATLIEAQVRFDDAVVTDQTAASPLPVMTLSGVGVLDPARIAMSCGDPDQPDLGPHTLDITILRQTGSPSSYSVNASLHVSGASSFREDVTLPTQTGSVGTGQTVHYDICL